MLNEYLETVMSTLLISHEKIPCIAEKVYRMSSFMPTLLANLFVMESENLELQMASTVMFCMAFKDNPKAAKMFLGQYWGHVQNDNKHFEMIFLQAFTILAEKLRTDNKDIFNFCIGYVQQLQNEPKISIKSILLLNEVDSIDEGKLSPDFIWWTLSFNSNGFNIQEEPENHAKFLFRRFLQNADEARAAVERFNKVCINQQLRDHLSHLCQVKLFKACDQNDQGLNQLLKLVAYFYEFRIISNIALRKMLNKLGIRTDLTPVFCSILWPLVENDCDPYFRNSKKYINEISEELPERKAER